MLKLVPQKLFRVVRWGALIAVTAIVLGPSRSDAEVHHFCTVMAGTQCHLLRARNAALLDQVAQQVRNDPAAHRAVSAVRSAAVAGTLKGAELAALTKIVRTSATEQSLQNIDVLLAQVAVNQQVQSWLLRGTPWYRAVPSGGNVPIALVPGLPRGQLIPLGFGPVLIGLDRAGDAIVLGTGDPVQIAAQISGEAPASVVATLANRTAATVNFTVNQQPGTLKPAAERELSGSTSFLVAFDRGEGNGTAQYQLGEGYYEFAVTDKGWELYHKAARSAAPAPEPPAYVQAAHVELPKGFKLFDPIPAITPADAAPQAKLPEHFSLFREAAGAFSRN